MKQPFLLSPPRTVRELAALLSAVRLLIGNDSGPKHLAAAVGTPTLTVYGPTDPRTWSPRGPAHLALQHEVTCGPCDRTSCPDLRCLLSVSAGRMAAWAQSALARGDTAPAPGADGGATRAR
jgi:ADP-heptose:LPS heptosyltransferase